MRVALLPAFALSAFFAAPEVSLGEEFQTAEVNVTVYRSSGAVTGCGITYTGAFRDFTYRQGALSGISGSVSFLKAPKQSFGLFFKIAVLDWASDVTAAPSFGAISKAYIRSGNAVAPDMSVQCENKAAYCGVGAYQSAFDFSRQIADHPIAVAFNRSPTGMDVQLELPRLTPNQFEEFFGCEQVLMESLKLP